MADKKVKKKPSALRLKGLEVLKETFGYDKFRPQQWKAMKNALKGRDTMVVMATGGGKSLCYQIPAILSGKTTVVVSPLISLMKDQVEQLNASGVSAAAINSTTDIDEHEVIKGTYRILYITPEKLEKYYFYFTKMLDNDVLGLLAIDEAHCVSEWGHDFRPVYRNISTFRRAYPDIPIIALTATATPRVAKDIMECLEMRNPMKIIGTFNRPNIHYSVQERSDPKKPDYAADLLHRVDDSPTIIYCTRIQDCEDIAKALSDAGIVATIYHGRLSNEIREANQNAFMTGDATCICATNAFGMGINKADIRRVIHYGAPKCIEAYYQETGRAGRDGAPSEAVLLSHWKDHSKWKLEWYQKDATNPKKVKKDFYDMRDYVKSVGCRRRHLLHHFGENLKGDCTGCDYHTIATFQGSKGGTSSMAHMMNMVDASFNS